MSAHVLFNLLNKLREKWSKARLDENFNRFFPNEFNKFNNTGARMLDSIYHMTLKLLKNQILAWKLQDFAML